MIASSGMLIGIEGAAGATGSCAADKDAVGFEMAVLVGLVGEVAVAALGACISFGFTL
jgi:hypothetical protein